VADGEKSISEVVGELKELTVSYAKQETIDPLRGLGRYVGFGIGGSFVLAIGLGMMGLAMLRALQTETGTWFTGNLNWVPYVLTFLALMVVIVVALLAVKKDAAR
jgi:hypothetical protein